MSDVDEIERFRRELARPGMTAGEFAELLPVHLRQPYWHTKIEQWFRDLNCDQEDQQMAHPTLRYFAWEHLPEKLQSVSAPFEELATWMDLELPDGAEKSAGMRKLLEAKDCMVRAALPPKED